ncbi:MAG: oligopeptide transporter, OPT family [Planctomycetes bacterium]|nr:oligopeptide transporter, OPT family [Planctomycetota bacterium]
MDELKRDNTSKHNNKHEFTPYITSERNIPEFSVRAIILGVILAIVFGAANAYVGLKVGMTVSASIPAAVISMTILRGVLKKGTVLENNMVQTIGSSGESLAAGVIFTIPALIFLGFAPSILEIFIMSALGGCLGILFMIPLRRYLIVREHNTLPYPEGTACAKILVAGEQGGTKALLVLGGALTGGVYKFLLKGLGLWKDEVFCNIKLNQQPLVQSTLSAEVSPVLLGVGYIIGPRIAALMLSGAVLGWFVLIPIIQYIGSGFAEALAPATKPINQLETIELWSFYIRYIGAGAVLLGGIVSLFKALPIIIQSIKQSIKNIIPSSASAGEMRTDRDMPIKYVLLISILVIIATFIYLVVYKNSIGISVSLGMGLISILLIILFGGVFVTVAARIVGIVGSSSSPVSGMTITTLIAISLIFVAFGWTDKSGMLVAMSIGAIVCIAVCMSGDISQDLKTSYLVGATPYKIQIAEFIGVLAPAIVIAGLLLFLSNTGKLGSSELKAPQASLMKMIVEGVFGGHLPWVLILIGAFIGLCVELLGISSLPFAIGLYLPFSLSAPIMIGGIIAWIISLRTKSSENDNERGVLFSSGLVAGDALMSIIIVFLPYIVINTKPISELLNIRGAIHDSGWENLLGFGIFMALAVFLFFIVKTHKNTTPPAAL